MYEAEFLATDSADWSQAIEFIDGDTGRPLNVEDADFELVVRDKGHCVLLRAKTEDDSIQRPSDSTISWRFAASEMKVLRHGNTYPVGLTMTTENGTVQVLVATLSFIDGVVR